MGYIFLGDDVEGIGGKASGFSKLKVAGVAFPAGIVLRQQEIEDILNGNVAEFETYVSHMSSHLAIRSSANVEDGYTQSYAGMFQTCLNVKNDIKSVISAVKQVYNSRNRSFIKEYNKQFHSEINMSIIIQEMIQNIKYNGVIFGDIVDEKGEYPVLLDFCKESENKIVDGHDRGNQILLYDDGNSFYQGHMIYTGIEKDIIWVDCICKVIDQIKAQFNHMKFDIEWCVDKNDRVYILQLRPTTSTIMTQSGTETSNLVIGSYGIASGHAVVFDDDSQDLDEKIRNFKAGDIFVAKYMDTRYYDSLEKASGIIVSSSSILAHAALVARENHVPCMIVKEDMIDKIQENDNISIDTYSKSIEINGERHQLCDMKVDWARIYDFDSIYALSYLNHEILLEQTFSGVVAHVSETASNKFCEELKKEYRELMGSDVEIRKSGKYLWYYEYCRYRKMMLFNQIVDLVLKAVDKRDLDAISEIYEKGYHIVQVLNEQKMNEHVIEKRLYLEEMIRSIFFAMDMYIPLGKGYKQVCLKIMPVLMNRGISFSEFVSFDKNEISDVGLLEERNLIDLLGKLRDQVTTRFCGLNAFDYDYYDRRTKLICKDIGACDEEIFLKDIMDKMNLFDNEIFNKYASLIMM